MYKRQVQHPRIPPAAARFLTTTQVLIQDGESHALAAAFAYGRELLVPDLFRALLKRLQALALPCPTLCWYLERHIALDGDSHGPLAEAMVLALVGDDAKAMQRVEQVKRQVIEDRKRFWDALHAELRSPVPV